VLNDSIHTLTWDVFSLPATIDSIGITYDVLGRMVERNNNGTITQVLYTPGGAKIANMSGQTLDKGFVQLPAGAVAEYSSNGGFYYRNPDWQGSGRLITQEGTPWVYYDGSYSPFGFPYDVYNCCDVSFTGMSEDTSANLYDFPAREYEFQGRWVSPDLAGLFAVDPTNPQSWNRYAYALNNPLANVDPTGLTCYIYTVDENGFTSLEELPNVNQGDCKKDGGVWIDPVSTTIYVTPDGDNGGSPAGGCASFYQDGVFIGNTCGSGGGGASNAGGGAYSSPTWAAIATFFTPPTTGQGSCVQVALDALNGPLNTIKSAAQNFQKYGTAGANAAASGATYVAVNLNNMLRARQLDPFLGPAVAGGASTIAAGLNYAASAVAAAAPYLGYAMGFAAEGVGFYAVGKEAVATFSGSCQP
jgi:RHS repeat-associated protein